MLNDAHFVRSKKILPLIYRITNQSIVPVIGKYISIQVALINTFFLYVYVNNTRCRDLPLQLNLLSRG